MRRDTPAVRRAARAALVLVAGSGLLAGAVLPASADPIYPSARQVAAARAAAAAKAAEVDAVQASLIASSARLDAVRAEAEQAVEQYNGAQVLLAQRSQAAQASRQRAAAAQHAAELASDKVGQLAAQAYMDNGSLGGLESFLTSKGPQEILDKAAGLAVVSSIRNRTLEEATASSVVAGVLQRQAALAQAQQAAAALAADAARRAAQSKASRAAAETARIQRDQARMVAQLASLRHTSVSLERERQQGLQAEAAARAAAEARARAAAAARARAAARAAAAREAARRAEARRKAGSGGSPGGGTPAPPPAPDPIPAPPPVSGGVSAVLAFARAQIGEPYVWGAAGPSSWDCSGLTMAAWAQAGVGLAHYTGAQWDETARVPLDELRPGDLVFYGDTGPTSHHVGLYVGGGQMIEAPYTGASVRYASIWRSDLLPFGGRPGW